MSDKTGIQWTGATWNPVSGCSKVSPGCKNCYAERDWARLSKNPKSPYFGRAFTDVKCHPERLDQPLRWRTPRKIFVNSMSDLFHEDVPWDFIDRVFTTMEFAPQHTFQVLTKRVDAMAEFCMAAIARDLPNIWFGVSVENCETLVRADVLRSMPAAVRFLSLEPLLEDLGTLDLRRIKWVIVGGESGPNARPCNVDWIRSVIAQCKAAGKACFVKQLGSAPYGPGSSFIHGKGGDPTEWPEDLRVREFPR